MNTEEARKRILKSTKPEHSTALSDSRLCCEMADNELETSGSDLADLASEAGYASLRGYINESYAWDKTVAEVASGLIEILEELTR